MEDASRILVARNFTLQSLPSVFLPLAKIKSEYLDRQIQMMRIATYQHLSPLRIRPIGSICSCICSFPLCAHSCICRLSDTTKARSKPVQLAVLNAWLFWCWLLACFERAATGCRDCDDHGLKPKVLLVDSLQFRYFPGTCGLGTRLVRIIEE